MSKENSWLPKLKKSSIPPKSLLADADFIQLPEPKQIQVKIKVNGNSLCIKAPADSATYLLSSLKDYIKQLQQ